MEMSPDKLKKQVKKILQYYTNSLNITPRSIGDDIESYVRQHLHQGYNLNDELITGKSIADILIQDKNDWYIDIKCHNVEKSAVPNLISVDRLLTLYESTKSFFVIVKIDYRIDENKVIFEDVDVFNIEDMSFDGLNIANIGKGQIQLKDASLRKKQTRKSFIKHLKESYLDFLEKQIKHFQKIAKDIEASM